MNWEAVGVIVDAVGMIAVIVTVIYLAVQTRQNTKAVQASVRQAMLSEETGILYKQMEFPAVAPFGQDLDALSDDELKQSLLFIVAFIRSREGYWLQYKNGMIDEETWLTFKSAILDVMTSRIGQEVWKSYSIGRGHFNKAFILEINEYLATAPVGAVPSIREALNLN